MRLETLEDGRIALIDDSTHNEIALTRNELDRLMLLVSGSAISCSKCGERFVVHPTRECNAFGL